MAKKATGWLRTALWAPLLLLAAGAEALTSDDEALGFERTPPRLGFADGAVSFFRANAEDWTPARVNTALAAGDGLFAAEGSNFELQVGPRANVRAGEQTHLGLTSVEPDFLQLRVGQGSVALDLRSLKPGQTFEVDTPHAALTVEQPGYYRVAVDAELTRITTRRGGQARVTTATGEEARVATGEQLVVRGGDAPQLELYAAPELDAWDRWNYARSEAQQNAQSARYVPDDVYGVSDLDAYGDWRVVPTYGALWVPRSVPVGWVPYSTGYWMSDPYYSWTWVDDAPWGWAPYHYGRWVYVSGYWGWCPGPRVARAYYAPALVAFYGGGDFSVGVSFGGPLLGWVALGWGEPLHPWWGPKHFRGHTHWAGWGGPRHHGWDDHHDRGHGHGRDHDRDDGYDRDRGHGRGHGDDRDHRDGDRQRGRDRHDYQNARVKDAIVAVDREHFGRRAEHARFRRARGDELRPLRGDGSDLPERSSRVADARSSRRPPHDAERRTVVASRERRGERRPDFAPERSGRGGRRRPDESSARQAPAARGFGPSRGFAPGESRGARDARDLAPRTRRVEPRRDSRPDEVTRRPPFDPGALQRVPPRARRAEDSDRREARQRVRPADEQTSPRPPRRSERVERDRPQRRDTGAREDRSFRRDAPVREARPPRATPPQASRGDRDAERRAQTGNRRGDRDAERRAQPPREQRVERSREPRSARAERPERVERPERAARAERADRSARHSDAGGRGGHSDARDRRGASDGERGGRSSGRGASDDEGRSSRR